MNGRAERLFAQIILVTSAAAAILAMIILYTVPKPPAVPAGSSITIFLSQNGTASGGGTLNVTVYISNTAPLCRANATAENVTRSTAVNVTLYSTGSVQAPRPAWTLYNGCELVGRFAERMLAGTYSVEVADPYMRTDAPSSVTIRPNATTDLNVSITTGIE